MGVVINSGNGIVKSAVTNLTNAAKKRSPELLVISGTALFIASLFSVRKTTLKNKEIVDSANEEIRAIKETKELHQASGDGAIEYTEEDKATDIKIVKRCSAKKIVAATAPTVLLAGAAISCFWGADYIRKERHAALFAAAEMYRRSFDDYRQGVIDKYGESADAELKYKLINREYEEEVTNAKGKKKIEKKQEVVSEYDGHSDFARVFAEWSNGALWTKDPVHNLTILLDAQREANRLLQERGVLTINDVYDLLYFERIKEGQFAGWVYNINDPTCVNGTHVDFGFWDMHNDEAKKEFLLGRRDSIILDFNIDTLDVWETFDDTPTVGLLKGRRKSK